MLTGDKIRLRTVRDSDIEQLYDFHQDIANRGAYFPIGVVAYPAFVSSFQQSGFWQDNEGMLLIIGQDDSIVGHIEFFQTVNYLDELELSYHIYSQEHQGQGIASQALRLMTDYLFDRKKHNRIRLIIHPDNAASKRIAEKCGYRYEGIARGAWYHRGRNHDVEVYARLRNDPDPAAP